MQHFFATQFRREWILALRSPQDFINPLIFFLMVSSLLPMAIGSDPAALREWGAGMIWVMALLSSMLSLDHLFRTDYEDGTLEQMLVRDGLFWSVNAKVLCHWLLTGIPLALFSPLLALMFGLSPLLYPWLLLTLAIGSLVFSLVGAIGAALTVCLRRSGILLPLIIMPLYIPVLIFGAGTVVQVAEGYNAAAALAILAAMAAFSLALAPLAITAALRIAVDN